MEDGVPMKYNIGDKVKFYLHKTLLKTHNVTYK